MISAKRPFQLRFPAPEVLFMVAAVSQYLGAALAVELFLVLAPAGTALLRVGSAALIMTIIMALRVCRGTTFRQIYQQKRLATGLLVRCDTCRHEYFHLLLHSRTTAR